MRTPQSQPQQRKQTMATPDMVPVNGRLVPLLVPELVEDMAIVDLNVIKRLAAMLPKMDLYQIRDAMISKSYEADTLEKYVQVLADEVSFHRSVNMITMFDPNEPQPSEEWADDAIRHARDIE